MSLLTPMLRSSPLTDWFSDAQRVQGMLDFEAALAQAKAGRWPAAAEAFEKLGDEAAAKTYAAKCRALAAAGAGAAWDGIWNLTEK